MTMIKTQKTVRVTGKRRTVFRVGLVLAGVMALFNTINGAGSLIDPTFGQTDPELSPQPVWMSVGLLVVGVTSLVALIPAWRGNRTAIWVVVLFRLAAAWPALLLPLLPGAPAGMWGFAVLLVVVGTAVAAMVAQGLRPLR